MNKIILIRYSEIHLKGKNRSFFENLLKKNLTQKLRDISCNIVFSNCRYIISDYDEADEVEIESRITKVFGAHSYSKAVKAKTDLDSIVDAAKQYSKASGTFRVSANRAEKRFSMTSLEIAREVGGRLLECNSNLSVDLHNPDFTIFIDVRSMDTTYVYSDSIPCAGGLPVGCSGKGLTLLSGGIDSPVSSYLLSKRGMKLTALHFWSYPYTNMAAKQKVIDLARIIAEYNGETRLIFASLTKMQEAIHKYADSNYMITLVRRAMMRISEAVAKNNGLQCIINGESLGQVASQTVESITVTNSVIKELPVLRPLIGMDKSEIIDVAGKIGTFKTSILPFEDCCTVFLPDSPVTKPSITRAEENERKIENYEEIMAEIIDNLEIIDII